MDGVNKTLYIPLYGKAYVSRKGILLRDPKAEAIWDAEGFPLKGKSKSKWLAYYMGMRSVVFDHWLQEQMAEFPEAVILHIGCGMDSRVERVGTQGHLWYDIDFPQVIQERKRYYSETLTYQMIASDVRDPRWLTQIPQGIPAVVVMEGVSMYLSPEELQTLLRQVCGHFGKVNLLMDCYTEFAAKASKYKNPINDVGVTQVYGMDDPQIPGLTFLKEHDMTPESMIRELHGMEKWIFQSVFAGKFAKKMYRLYAYTAG